MRIRSVTLATILGVALSHTALASGYTITPTTGASGLGNFYAAALLDNGIALGWLSPTGGFDTIGLAAVGARATELDYCGTTGQADGTVITAASPGAVARYYVGSCNEIAGFVHDNSAGATTRLNVAFSDTIATAVNAGGIVAGEYFIGQAPRGYYFFNGQYVKFDPPASEWTIVAGITDIGTIFGSYFLDVGSHGFLLDQFGHYKIVTYPLASETFITGMNSHNQAAGYYAKANVGSTAFEWKAGRFNTFPIATATASQAVAINEKGVVAGTYKDAAGAPHGFAWLPATGGVFTIDIPENGNGLTITGINNHHAQVTGYYNTGSPENPTIVSFIATCTGRCF